MASSDLIFGRPDEELLSRGTVSLVDGALDASYALNGLSDGNPGTGVLFTTDHARLVVDHGADCLAQFVVLVHVNLRVGATGAFQRNATNDWDSPAQSDAFTFTDPLPNGLRPNPWLDLRARTTPYRYSSYVFSGNGVPLIFGQVPLYAVLHQEAILGPQPTLTPITETTIQPTIGRAELRTVRGVAQWQIEGAQDISDEESFAALLAWNQACQGASLPTTIVCEPWIPGALFVRFLDDQGAVSGPTLDFRTSTKPSWLELQRLQVWP